MYPDVKEATKQASKIATFFKRKKKVSALAGRCIRYAKKNGHVETSFTKVKKPRNTRLCSEHACLQSLRALKSVLQRITMKDGQIVRQFAKACGSKDEDIALRKEMVDYLHTQSNWSKRETAENILEPTTVFARVFDTQGTNITKAVPAWFTMKYHLKRACEKVDAGKWPDLQKRLKKREEGFTQTHNKGDQTVNHRIAPFLTPEMHVGFLLSPQAVLKSREHANTKPPGGQLNY